MALLKSTIFAQMSGSIAGTVYSHNAGGMYARTRSIPVNPASSAQTLIRNGLSESVWSWLNTLTNLQRIGWDLYAKNTPITNRLGDVTHLTALASFIKLNAFRKYLGSAMRTDPPGLYGVGAPITLTTQTLDASTNLVTTDTVTLADPGGLTGDQLFGIWISPAVTVATNFYKGPWKFLGPVPGDSITGFSDTPPFTLVVGAQHFMRYRYHDDVGRLSAAYITPRLTVTI